MDDKQAIEAAKSAIADLFGGEGATQISFEEIEFDEADRQWRVAIDFYRPRTNLEAHLFGNNAAALAPRFRRDRRVVTIADADGRVLSVKEPLGYG